MDKKPDFWKHYDRASRVDFGGTLLGIIFDWKGWITGAFAGGGGAMTFLWAAIADRSALDVWVLAVVVAAALAAFSYFSISAWERYVKPKHSEDIAVESRQSIDLPRDQATPATPIPQFDWKSAPDAVEAFAESSLLAERDKQGERLEKAALRRLDAEFKIDAILKALPDHKAIEGTGEFEQIEQQKWQIKANTSMEQRTEPYVRQAWDKLREDIRKKLADGKLIAKGFRDPHVSGNSEVEISFAEWRILTLDNVNSTALRNGEVAYSGLVIRTA